MYEQRWEVNQRFSEGIGANGDIKVGMSGYILPPPPNNKKMMFFTYYLQNMLELLLYRFLRQEEDLVEEDGRPGEH
jgi:hypothetical protein